LSREVNTERIKTYLRRHKYEGGNRAGRILVLWVGRPKQKTYGKWEQKIVLISNLVDRGDIDFRNQYIYLPEKKFDEALPWGVFKEASGEEIAELFRRS
ncbi:MAG: hypothetical protein QHH30_03610, partial [candidate division NC10 bacterium]|nr:hypothetical protein [candidate division NC10 bacterium]